MMRGMLWALMALLLAFAWPAEPAHAQSVTCPSAGPGENLNIVTTGGVTTCTNIGTAKATQGIEIYNALTETCGPPDCAATFWNFGIAFRNVTTAGNQQPSDTLCFGACADFVPTGGGAEPYDSETGLSRTTTTGRVYDWLHGAGITTLLQCGSYFAGTDSCAISFVFADGTSASFTVPAGSNTVPSFALGGVSTTQLPPTITSVSPTSGPMTGGTTVTIRGTNLDTATKVTHFCFMVACETGMVFTGIQVISSTEITAVTPTNPSLVGKALPIYVRNPVGVSQGSATPFVFLPPALAIATSSLPNAALGTAYNAQISATGGTPAIPLGTLGHLPSYSFSATGLPPGLNLASDGKLTGVPLKPGTSTISVAVTDTVYEAIGGTTVTKSLQLTVEAPVSVTTASLASGMVGTPYTASLVASGGTAPYTFTATGLPNGLSIVGSNITGTPTQAGTFTVGITATDATTPTPIASLDRTLSLAIAVPDKTAQTITFTQPAGIAFKSGTTVALTASASSGLPVTFASTTLAVCTVSGTTASIVAPGTCSIKASQAGNATFAAAPDVTVSFTVASVPVLSATATVTPDKFSRPGEQLAFVITLANAGSSTATGIRISEPRLANLVCAATTLGPGATLICQGTTLTTAADLAAGKVSISPQLTYTYGGAQP